MRLGSKNTYPKVQGEQPHRKQRKRTGAFWASFCQAQAFSVDKIGDHERRQRCHGKEEETIEIQNEVCDVIAPMFCSVQLGALPRCCGEDVVLDDVPGNNCKFPVSE